jgi:hypothetical protein
MFRRGPKQKGHKVYGDVGTAGTGAEYALHHEFNPPEKPRSFIRRTAQEETDNGALKKILTAKV